MQIHTLTFDNIHLTSNSDLAQLARRKLSSIQCWGQVYRAEVEGSSPLFAEFILLRIHDLATFGKNRLIVENLDCKSNTFSGTLLFEVSGLNAKDLCSISAICLVTILSGNLIKCHSNDNLVPWLLLTLTLLVLVQLT